VSALLQEVEGLLREASVEQHDLEARRIVEAAYGDRELSLRFVQQRLAGMPLGYVLGYESFMGLKLIAAPGALVPREETELLGYTAVDTLRGLGTPSAKVIDMCCGSGNLACGIASHLPTVRVWASDVTDGCVTLTRRNVTHLGLEERVTVVQGDLFAGLRDFALEGAVDLVVCNPPYISEKRLAGDRGHLLQHEPREAFDGGPYGLSIYQRVVKEALTFLRPGGTLLFEIGLGQDRQVQMLFDRTHAYEDVRMVKNEAGDSRVASGKTRS
jgi:release factor glutamine methyltransferase